MTEDLRKLKAEVLAALKSDLERTRLRTSRKPADVRDLLKQIMAAAAKPPAQDLAGSLHERAAYWQAYLTVQDQPLTEQDKRDLLHFVESLYDFADVRPLLPAHPKR